MLNSFHYNSKHLIMKNLPKLLLLFFLVLSTALSSCKKDPAITEPPVTTQTISGDISVDMSLKENIQYTIKGKVFVKNNATLTIPAGVTVLVEAVAANADKAALIISPGSKLNISGNVDKPVVFTSAASTKAPGDWIGIIILGKAPTNGPGGLLNITGLPATAQTEFGGSTATDNSGSIKYLRVEYAGGLNPVNEVEWDMDMASGLSLSGVGSATTIENVIVKYSRDDAFQFIGGTVNAKYLIAYNDGDDSFDFDRGYTGKLQFLISYNAVPSTVAIRANGVESLNDKDASAATPYTRPVISNMTIIGPEGTDADMTNQSQGIYIRKNTRFNIQNSIIAGYSNGGLMMCTKTKPLCVNNLGSEFKYNLVHSDYSTRAFTFDYGGSGIIINPDPEVAGYAIQENPIEKPSLNKNKIINATADFKLKGLYAAVPDLSPASGSPALTNADLTGADFSTFYTSAAFIGAIGTNNWASGNWVHWQ